MGIYLQGLELYPAIVRREGQFFQADFCDIPDCRGYGASAGEAEAAAAEALIEHAATLGRYGRFLPRPSRPTQLTAVNDSYIAYIAAPLP